MHGLTLAVRVFVVLLAVQLVLDFGLTVEGAFAFNVDESVVGIGTAAVAVTAPAIGPSERSTTAPRSRLGFARVLRPPTAVFSASLVPRSCLVSSGDGGDAADAH
ncbi:MAG TPA: hypothetical protein VEA38_06180 [Terriglobales bacterium]|nr:hypothetical protein [Terriglobales bacterium]